MGYFLIKWTKIYYKKLKILSLYVCAVWTFITDAMGFIYTYGDQQTNFFIGII